jgi:hypothetical protein
VCCKISSKLPAIVNHADLEPIRNLLGQRTLSSCYQILLSTPDRIAGVQVRAGTGKTTALGIAGEIANHG